MIRALEYIGAKGQWWFRIKQESCSLPHLSPKGQNEVENFFPFSIIYNTSIKMLSLLCTLFLWDASFLCSQKHFIYPLLLYACVFSAGLSCCGVLFAILLGVVAVLAGLYLFCSSHMEDKACKLASTTLLKYWTKAQTFVKQYYT